MTDGPTTDGGDAGDGGDGGEAGPILPPTTPLSLAKGNVSPLALTSDGWVFYSDANALTASAVSLQGGNPVGITPAGVNGVAAWAVGPVAFVSYKKNNVGSLIVWTHAGGAHTIASWDGRHRPLVSNDGSRLLYAMPGATAGTFDYIEANIDLSNPVTLATSIEVDDQGVAGDRFIVESAQRLADGGATVSIDSFDVAGKKVHLSDDGAFTTAAASDTVLLYATKGVSTVSASMGGTPVQIATNFFAVSPSISPNGKYGAFVNENNIDHSIWSFTMASPKPAALPATNGEQVHRIFFSPDGAHFAVQNGLDPVAIVSTTAGNQTRLDSNGYVVNEVGWFTNDSRYMIAVATLADGGVGGLAAIPLDTLNITPIAKAGDCLATLAMTGTSRVLFLSAANGLLVVDAAQPDAPVSIAKDATAVPWTMPVMSFASNFLLNAAGDGVVYVNGTDLLYVAVP
jgi:hypothetical protein